jgi:hypothetical protein
MDPVPPANQALRSPLFATHRQSFGENAEIPEEEACQWIPSEEYISWFPYTKSALPPATQKGWFAGRVVAIALI